MQKVGDLRTDSSKEHVPIKYLHSRDQEILQKKKQKEGKSQKGWRTSVLPNTAGQTNLGTHRVGGVRRGETIWNIMYGKKSIFNKWEVLLIYRFFSPCNCELLLCRKYKNDTHDTILSLHWNKSMFGWWTYGCLLVLDINQLCTHLCLLISNKW